VIVSFVFQLCFSRKGLQFKHQASRLPGHPFISRASRAKRALNPDEPDYPISTGSLEGTNNKINTLQRQAYGFRDMQFFTLKIFGLHETKYALLG
jgi:hypothetical protein